MALLGLRRDVSGPPLVWLHGFTQTSDSARRFRTILAGRHDVLALDLPGHGQNAPVFADLNETADLLAAAIPEATFALGGYSYGARVALHLALRHPERVTRLVLLGATRGIDDESARRERRASDEEWARRIERDGVDEFLDAWLAQPIFATLATSDEERSSRSRDATGLAESLRRCGTGQQAWLGPRLSEIHIPTLVLSGSLDAKFTLEANALAAGIPLAQRAVIEDAGHAAHLERPESCAKVVLEFLS